MCLRSTSDEVTAETDTVATLTFPTATGTPPNFGPVPSGQGASAEGITVPYASSVLTITLTLLIFITRFIVQEKFRRRPDHTRQRNMGWE